MSGFMFPTEMVNLPSKGKFYPKDHPLRQSGGKLEIKYMTAKEEDILTSTNLITNGTVYDKLLESIVVHPGVDYLNLTTGDLSAVLIASRVLSYGKDYSVEIECNECGNKINFISDLSLFESPDNLVEPDDNGYYSFETSTGLKVVIKPMTRGDELQVEKENKIVDSKYIKMGSHEVTSRLKKVIVSINGVTDKQKLSQIIDNLIVKDTNEIRKQLVNVNPTVDMTVSVKCECGNVITGELPLGVNFFWPDIKL